jgi:hypothetical protein
MAHSRGLAWSCRECGEPVSGNAQHCACCHETFSGTAAGDRHRVGPQSNRRCLSREEMQEKGLRKNARGVWAIASTGTWWEGLR